jgi:hypothetical protein
MQNSVISIKIKQRLNKLDSQDYDNIECWQIVEAFNKAQVEWSRRQLHGLNVVKEGDEQSTRRIDDLQALLITTDLPANNEQIAYSIAIPENYLQWKRVDAYAKQGCCDNRRMTIYLAEEANINQLLRDDGKKPSFAWAETFATIKNNKVYIYTNDDFEISKTAITYYRQPRRIQIQGCIDPYTGEESTSNVLCEFKDDIIEVILDDAASIIAGDIESVNQFSRGTQTSERNN